MYKVKKHLSDIFLITSFIAIGAVCLFFYTSRSAQETPVQGIADIPKVTPIEKFGFDISEVVFEDYRIKRNAFMGDILMSYGVSFDKILELERKAEEVFSLRKIMAGKDITLVKEDECGLPKSFIYKPGRLNYVRYDFGEEVVVSRHEVPHEICIESATGIVTKSLWDAMMEQGFDVGLIDKMEDAVAQVNFHFAQPGDQFKLIYERVYVEGEPISTGKIYSAAYKSDGVIDFGFYFENEKYKGYYDLEGIPNKRTFLNAPVRFSRVSSVFNPNRFHPVLKRRKAHLGTDYAAPRGTPIFAVADGVITKRSYTRGNGNYIKIKHDKTYQTQYLHMSKFAKGLRPGSRVSQGQTIGYVGSTGLATGPHVCFRFWKNGRQVNHMRENFPPLNPMSDSDLPKYYTVRDKLFGELEAVSFTSPDVVYAGYAD